MVEKSTNRKEEKANLSGVRTSNQRQRKLEGDERQQTESEVKCVRRAIDNTLGKHNLHRPGWQFGGKGGHGKRRNDRGGYVIQTFQMLFTIAKLKLKPQQIRVREICQQDMDVKGLWSRSFCYWKHSRRMANACPSIPGVLVETSQNPCGLPYRMIDGNHRLCALKLKLHTFDADSNFTAPFFVLPEHDAENLIEREDESRHIPANVSSIVESYMESIGVLQPRDTSYVSNLYQMSMSNIEFGNHSTITVAVVMLTALSLCVLAIFRRCLQRKT